MFRKQRLAALLFLLLSVSGCSDKSQENLYNTNKLQESSQNIDDNRKEQSQGPNSMEAVQAIAKTYQDIQKTAVEHNALDDLEVVRSIINRLGEYGYVAVDSKNQINMVGAEQVDKFCRQVEEKETGDITIIVVSYDGGFKKYDLTTKGGSVNITEEYCTYKNGSLESLSTTSYPAYSWRYTEEGYLFFEQYHMPGFDGPSGHTAIRVQPLDETCRELNRKYILPIGYECNNMFLLNWNENNFGELNFYDLFDVLYPEVYGQPLPYVADENCGVGAIYRILREEFEKVIMSRFRIDSETLQTKTTYFPQDESYEYRPRGLYDCEPPSYPYPEVVDYKENNDNTLTLTVNVVYPDNNTSKVYAHEVVVRPLADGSFQYVSNQVIPSENNQQESWHINRLTKEEWKAFYGGAE